MSRWQTRSQSRGQEPPRSPGRHTRTRDRGREERAAVRSTADQSIQDIGRLRMVAADDLVRHVYRGDESKAQPELRRLSEKGLIRRQWMRRRDGTRWAALYLTEKGRRRAQEDGVSGQQYYSGFVKQREAEHDAALYRAYLDASSRLEGSGRRVRRVTLDYELKRSYQRALAESRGPMDERQQEAARHLGLKIQSGKVALPDVRLEYEADDDERGFVDLEVATDHYKQSQIAEKARAGFAVYGTDGQPGAPVKDGPELLEEVFSI